MRGLRYISLGILISLLLGCGSPLSVSPQVDIEIPLGKFYFYADSCPHCVVVNEYIRDNKVRQKLYFITQNAGTDQYSVNLLHSIGKRCAINEADLAVPLFWDGQKCYLGEEGVISYFQTLQ